MDNNLDNDTKTITNAKTEIDAWLSCFKGVKVAEVKEYVDTTLFILTSCAIEKEDDIRNLLKNKVRYTVEYAHTEVNLADNNDDPEDPISNYTGRFPIKCQTLAIRRKAFKKLVICNFLYQGVLCLILCFIFYTLFCVLF